MGLNEDALAAYAHQTRPDSVRQNEREQRFKQSALDNLTYSVAAKDVPESSFSFDDLKAWETKRFKQSGWEDPSPGEWLPAYNFTCTVSCEREKHRYAADVRLVDEWDQLTWYPTISNVVIYVAVPDLRPMPAGTLAEIGSALAEEARLNRRSPE